MAMIEPTPQAAPKEGTLPARFGKRNNLAGDADLCDAVRAYASTQIERFRGQSARDDFVKKKGTMDQADRMWRAAQDVTSKRDTASSQYEATLSNTASPIFHEAIRTITAGETAIYFGERDVPARYEPEIDNSEYTDAEGKNIADQQNILEEYTFEHDGRKMKIKDGCLFKNKYGHKLWSIEWDRRTAKRRENTAIKDANGVITGYTTSEKERTIADWPTLISHPLQNFYADSSIDDLQMQRLVALQQKAGYEDLADQQRGGSIMNVAKITDASLFLGEATDTKSDRNENAGTTLEDEQTGLYDVWQVWARLPIKEFKRKGTPTGKGKWDNSVAPEWYWLTFVGDITSGKGVCVRFIKNPYNHGKLPYLMEYALPDDKGLYHIAPSDIVQSLYWQIVTNMNQAIDNVTLRTRTPYTLKGTSNTRDMTARANKVIKLGMNAELKPLETVRTTEITMEMKRALSDDFNVALGVTDPVMGEAFGQRTSALEANTAFEQAMKPLMQKADNNATVLFTWMLEMDAELWRQFGNPQTILSVSHNNMIEPIRPDELFGPYKVAVVAPTEFENNISVRREINAFLQNGYQAFAAVAGMNGQREFMRWALPKFGVPRVNAMLPPNGDFDATRRAVEAVDTMLNISGGVPPQPGVFVEPRPEDNQAAWLAVTEPALREYELLPEGERLPENIMMMKQHNEMRRNMMAQQQSQGQVPGENMPEGTPAELAMNPFEGQMGAQA